MKYRTKPCRHCLFSKNHLGTEDDKKQFIMEIDQSSRLFSCHEHSETVLCNGFCRRHPDRVPTDAKGTSENGDLKSKFSHMTREQMNRCTKVSLIGQLTNL